MVRPSQFGLFLKEVTTWVRDEDADSDKELMAPTSMMTSHPICLFVEEDMIALWDAALQTNHRY